MTDYIVTKISDTQSGIYCEFAPCDAFEKGDGSITLLFGISDFYEARLHEGDCISDERFEELYEISSLAKAICRAQKLIAQGDYSKKRLIMRLCRYDIDKNHAEKAASIMEEKGYINEYEQAKRMARYCCTRKLWGKKRIFAELSSRGYEKKAIIEAVDSITAEEYACALDSLMDKKFSTPIVDKKDRDKRIASLMRMGFSLSEISRAASDRNK